MKGSDLAIRGAEIITMNRKQMTTEAIVIRDGQIKAIGNWEEVAPYAEGIRTLDLSGKTIVPGFIDTHTHFLWTAFGEAAVNVSPANAHEELQTIIREAVVNSSPGELIIGAEFTEYPLERENKLSIRAALDAIAPDNPVFLFGITGHSSAANSLMLESLDFPDGIRGIAEDADGVASGMLADQANSIAFKKILSLPESIAKTEAMIEKAIEIAHSVGITTLHALEGGLDYPHEVIGKFRYSIPDFPLRIVLYYQTMEIDKVIELGLPRIGGCILLDGDMDPKTAALLEPYADEGDYRGNLYYEDDVVNEFALAAHKEGLQIAFHAVGDAAVEQALNAYELAINQHPREDHRHRIEHCSIMHEDQILRAHRLGVALAIQPPFNHYWPHTNYYRYVGEDRAWKVDQVRTFMRPGLLVAGGSDSTVTPMGPLIGIHASVNHSNPAERVGVYDAMELYTINAARIAFQENDRGSLEIGKLGDLVILAENPFEVDQRTIKDIKIEKTVIGGKIVYQADGS
jgi:predicted amidohydrolase YtcJ